MVKALAALVDAICVPANARESLTSLLFFMRYIWQLMPDEDSEDGEGDEDDEDDEDEDER